MYKTIVFGASGQLGQCLQTISKEKNLTDFVFLPEEHANILDVDILQKVFRQYEPAFCINCAAYTAVDKAEDETELAERINVDGVVNLAILCQQFATTLIHVSTDFVFSGGGNKPLTEEDETIPLSVYGLTKLKGELVLKSLLSNYFILRTSWLYSEYGNNFVKTMLRLGKEKDELKVIWDQVGTPTYAIDLATCILEIIQSDNKQYGTYHYSNEGLTSWYDFTKAIFELSRLSPKVVPISTAEYLTKAARPAFSVMNKSKIKQNLGIHIPHWKESLKKCINKLQ